jgi:hypothetical protein
MEATGTSICELSAPAVLLLADVCNALGLDESDQRLVLGEGAATWLEQWGSSPVLTRT